MEIEVHAAMTTALITQIQEFVNLQLALLAAFKRKFPSLTDWLFLLDFPKMGTVEVNGIEWAFQKHGSGLLFKRSSDGLVADIHRMLGRPEYFDAWRLQQYFESLGLERHEREINVDLKQLALGGLLEEDTQEPGLYRLTKIRGITGITRTGITGT